MGFRPHFYFLLVLISGVLLLFLTTNLSSYIRDHWLSRQIAKTMNFLRKGEEAQKETRTSFSVLSYNIWFDHIQVDKRTKALSELILELYPHFIALQEVTQFNLKALQKMPWFSLYKCFFARENLQGNYFVAIFVLKFHSVKKWKALPKFQSSDMGRALFWVDSEINTLFDIEKGVYKKLNFTLGTAHLESLSTLTSSKKREKQLNEVLTNHLNSFSDVCFTGDTNIDNIDGVVTLPGTWKDLWLQSGKTDEQGYTWDSSVNHFVEGSPKKARYDRMICKLKNFKLEDIRVVGDLPKFMDGMKIFPSDHFGIFATFAPMDHPLEDVVQGPQTVKFDRS